jgi:hypothetical protein
MVSLFDRAGSLARGLRRKSASKRSRRDQDLRLRTAIDRLESRLALTISTPLSIGGTTVGSFTDAPTGPGNIGDFVTVSIEGTRGTVIFNGGKGVVDGTDIQTIEIVDASPDFQLTFNGTIRTANPVPYGSDGIIQLGTITTSNVIRGINTVRGPATNVAVAYTPYGFTQTGGDVGTANMSLTGDVTSTFVGGAPGTFVVATPLLPSAGTPVFTTVSTSSYTAGTDTTAITLAAATGGSTTAGALTTAEVRNVEFQLTKFVGVNFSNRNLKEGGGLFVDTVIGDGLPGVDGLPNNQGIVLSQGLLAYSTIGIRKQLTAAVLLGTARNASVDGRMFVESALLGSEIYVGTQNDRIAKNSTFELVGGQGPFDVTNVVVNQVFQGVINLRAAAVGNYVFNRGVGSRARLNATSWRNVLVNGDFAGQINAPNVLSIVLGNLSLGVSGNLSSTARVNAGFQLRLNAGGSVAKGATVAAGDEISLDIGGNFAGSMSASGTISGAIDGSLTGATLATSSYVTLDVGGSVVNSSVSAYYENKLDVAGSIRNSRFFSADDDTSIDVQGSVVNSGFNVGYDNNLTLSVDGNLSGSSLQAGSEVSVDVAGNVTKTRFAALSSDVLLNVGGNLLNSRIVTGDGVSLAVGRDALDNTVLGDADLTLDIGRNWRGTAQSAGNDLLLDVGGSVLGGSSFLSGEDTLVNVARNFDGSTTSRDLRFFVGGNVSQASRIVAQRVTDWQNSGSSNFVIAGRLDGIVNVGVFDAIANTGTITILGNGAGTSARFNVGQFETDTLVFNGNFRGNLRTLQDLKASLQFNGNVDRITIGGRVGSFEPNGTPVPVSINVAGRLLYLNSNSYFEATAPGTAGTFWNDTQMNSSTGTLTTGSYVTVVPTLQTQPAPANPDPMTYNVPGTPTSFSAVLNNTNDGINVSFAAPTSNGNLPVIYYEYTTNNGSNWRRFDTASQGPGTDIPLTVDSSGNAFAPGNYNVAVRAVNALGAGTATTSQLVTIPPPP